MARGTGHPISEDKRRQMFSAYCQKAACTFVSKTCGVSEATARRYRDLDNWDERLAEIRRQVGEQDQESITEAKKRQLRIVRKVQGKFEKELEGGGVDVKPADVIAAMKHELLLRDEPTEREEVAVVEHLTERYVAYVERQRVNARRRTRIKEKGQ